MAIDFWKYKTSELKLNFSPNHVKHDFSDLCPELARVARLDEAVRDRCEVDLSPDDGRRDDDVDVADVVVKGSEGGEEELDGDRNVDDD